MRNYKCLKNQISENEIFSLIPLRDSDKYDILEIRNSQIEHLRQDKPLTKANQENYFETVVSKLFDVEKPNQILFSFLKNNTFVGYGGLVHINWVDKNAEISFVMKSELQTENFEFFWINFLELLEKIAFKELNFHKIYTYAFDIRPHLYIALEKAGFIEDARLKDHCLFNNKFIDVVMHSKINKKFNFRKANNTDCELYFEWTNDKSVRMQSFNSDVVLYENHKKWFLNKIEDSTCLMLIFQNYENINVGQVRIQKMNNQTAVIGVSIAKEFRGKGFASVIIEAASISFLNENPDFEIDAYIKEENIGSKIAFEKANFEFKEKLNYENFKSFHYIKKGRNANR
ncbi:GNAT family N-acetyltransferase [Flavobacterium psychrophilum]|uniref:GNAT family N-acetyltransferase n=1 Tax=Flavobacterium psychrophilum TaxID=96345 RepID=UPI001D09060B|nr:GNAT family N-acetyltransferase [Flavobacterium psychrophilum]EKT3956842.1 GNAT family N-acetyltransferase [Flavobacterium psychrophilum]EKT4508455.1 GNAT family N-acetyltransferase [Flavobacterium psychrophilum]MCB6088580.1 GNAT family N-acetyltransferase [Flavobacterium psychrophilum]